MHRKSRLGFLAAAIAAAALPVVVASQASAAPYVRPTITVSEASFAIPAGSTQAWLIRLWTMPTKPSTLEGQTFGSSGTISVAVPATKTCEFQADVLVAPAGTTKPADFKWYSGLVATVPDCGPHCPSSVQNIQPTGGHVKPAINNVDATFTIPSGPTQAWMIRLWTMPTKPSTLVGLATGSSGTLNVSVPLTQTCEFQVDVLVAPAGTTKPSDFTWYSGAIATV